MKIKADMKSETWQNSSDERFVFGLSDQGVVSQACCVERKRHKIPEKNTLVNHDFFKMKEDNECYLYTSITHFDEKLECPPKPLENLSRKSKLTIYCHGNKFSIFTIDNKKYRALNAGEFVTILKGLGLTEIGVLKIESCNLGKGKFIDELKEKLKENEIKFGYISAPKGLFANTFFNVSAGKMKHKIESKIGIKSTCQKPHIGCNVPIALLAPPIVLLGPAFFSKKSITKFCFAMPSHCPGHRKIVKGDLDIEFPGTVYRRH
jgi:hypothetical protein